MNKTKTFSLITIVTMVFVLLPTINYAAKVENKPVISKTVLQNTQKVLKTCRCEKCDLQHAKLGSFQPGSTNPNTNGLAKNLVTSACQTSCDFEKANLSYANLQNSNFTICKRGYVTPLQKVNFKEANLSYAQLQNSIFYGVKFENAKLTHANLSHSDLSLADFHDVDLSWANLEAAKAIREAMHGWGANMSLANFSHANLRNATLYANFAKANFSHSDLSNATLSTSLDSGDFQSSDELWEKTNFSHANLKGATMMDMSNENKQPDFSKAIFCQTTMPDGKLNNRDCKNKQ